MGCFTKEFLPKVIWYQVFLPNTNNLQTDLFDLEVKGIHMQSDIKIGELVKESKSNM